MKINLKLKNLIFQIQNPIITKILSKKIFSFIACTIFFSQLLWSQNDTIVKNSSLINSFNADITLQGMGATDEVLPFWLYSNKLGRIDKETNFLTLGSFGYKRSVSKNALIDTKVGVLYNDFDGVFIDQLYATFTNSWIEFNTGLKHRDVLYENLSSVGGDVLWSGNSRAIPGVELKTSRSIKLLKWFGFRANIAHYELNDTRSVDGAMIHHKSLYLDFKLSESSAFSIGLRHYVQWGGFSQEFGQQDESLSSLGKIFLGKSGGNTENDQINALGNHIASYQVGYNFNKEKYNLELYHQNLFEDRSGRELNNFPDGVWGVYFKSKSSNFIKSILYEYVQTISQSGRPLPVDQVNQNSGGDNYFNNTVFSSGWVYNGNTIGLPFIIPREDNRGVSINRSIAHHLGVFGSFSKFDYRFKGTYAKYLGSYGNALIPAEKAIYIYGQLIYPSKYGSFSIQTGVDYSNYTKGNLGVNLGYSYSFLD